MPEKGARSKTYVIIAALGIIVMLAAGGFVIYQMSLPAVWTETLKVKNSTGQFDIVTKYRNASNPGLADLAAFLDAENATIKSLADSDDTYRPVEYAIKLHDDAERAGINCSVVPFDVASDLPGHVVVAFNTKGNGMIYIDPASLNASSADFPGIAYDKIIFLRDQWNHTLSVQDGGNGSITVREYRKARPVSYNDMVQFLAMDDTDRNPGRANATSADFAVRLHDNAEAAGLLNAIVLVHFIEENYTTYLNAFATVEKGVVYIDDLNTVDPVLSTIFKPHDNVAYLANGSKMGALPIELIGGNLDYDYFLNQNAMIDPIFKDAMLYIEGIGGLDFDLSLYQERLQANKDSYTRYLEDRAKLDAEMKQYRSNFQNRTTDWPTLVRRSEGLDQKLNEIRYTSNMLEQEKQSLDKRQDNLDKKRESLAAREENKWLSYYPRVTVKEIQILW